MINPRDVARGGRKKTAVETPRTGARARGEGRGAQIFDTWLGRRRRVLEVKAEGEWYPGTMHGVLNSSQIRLPHKNETATLKAIKEKKEWGSSGGGWKGGDSCHRPFSWELANRLVSLCSRITVSPLRDTLRSIRGRREKRSPAGGTHAWGKKASR